MCRVPSRGFTRAPEPPQLTYLCRFAVRAVGHSIRLAFLGPAPDRACPGGLSHTSGRHDGEQGVPSPSCPTGYGISTVCPSSTPLGLDLGPTNLGRTNLAQEPLGFRRGRFPLPFSLLIPAFALPWRPPVLPVWLHPARARSPTPPPDPWIGTQSQRRWRPSAPDIVGAGALDQSAITHCFKGGCF